MGRKHNRQAALNMCDMSPVPWNQQTKPRKQEAKKMEFRDIITCFHL
jgi:hypothetical protein